MSGFTDEADMARSINKGLGGGGGVLLLPYLSGVASLVIQLAYPQVCRSW